MDIIDIQCLRGRNIYSHKPVIKLIVDLKEYCNIPTKDIDDFNNRLTALLPGLYKHKCSPGYEGGFLERLEEGTYLAHVAEHIILELQYIAGYDIKFGKARLFKEPNLYYIICQYMNERCAIEAARLACKIINSIINKESIDITRRINDMIKASTEYELGPSTKAIVDAAAERGIPVMRLGNESLVQLGYGKHQRLIQSTITDAVRCINADIASNKLLTKQLLRDYDIPVPAGDIAYTEEAAVQLAREIGFPVVVKPYDGNQGKGVVLNIKSEYQVRQAFQSARAFSNAVMVEQYIEGNDYRILVVGDKVSAVSQRNAAKIISDGIRNIEELVQLENTNPLRGEGHEKPLTQLKIDDVCIQVLERQGLSIKSVPEKGRVVFLRENGNLSTGGTAIDKTDMIHPYNAEIAVKAAKIIGLDIAGIDITSPDISVPLYKNGGCVIEVNAAPGIRMHLYPSGGLPRNVGKDIIHMLFPEGTPFTIPIAAITGTNGKTTTTRMVAQILKAAGLTVGMTTTSGIYVDDECILKGDNTGPASARMLLRDKRIEAAVLETARGGIIKRGLGYDLADVGVITNITEDHLGLDGINTIHDLAFVKALVAEAVKPDGYAVLNADDSMVLSIVPRIKANIIFFSRDSDNPAITEHINKGGKCVYVKDNIAVICDGKKIIPVINIKKIPATYGGRVECNIENSLAAISTAYGLGLSADVIAHGLKSFRCDINTNPGRFNLFEIADFKVLVDYGHNYACYKAVIHSVKQLGYERLVGIIGMPGDRLNNSIKSVGELCGKNFSKIYIKEDKDLRGRKRGEIADILYEGVLQGGAGKENVEIIYDEVEALKKAILDAHPNDIIVIFYENFDRVVKCIKRMKADMERNREIGMELLRQPAG